MDIADALKIIGEKITAELAADGITKKNGSALVCYYENLTEIENKTPRLEIRNVAGGPRARKFGTKYNWNSRVQLNAIVAKKQTITMNNYKDESEAYKYERGIAKLLIWWENKLQEQVIKDYFRNLDIHCFASRLSGQCGFQSGAITNSMDMKVLLSKT